MKQKLEVKNTLEINDAVKYLEDFVKALKAGTVSVQSDDESVVLKPENSVEVEVSAQSKDGKEAFAVKVKWKKGLPQGAAAVKISDKAPAKKAEPKKEKSAKKADAKKPEENKAPAKTDAKTDAKPTEKAPAAKPTPAKAVVKTATTQKAAPAKAVVKTSAAQKPAATKAAAKKTV